MNFHLIFLIIVGLINFFLGFFVWQTDKKNIINKSFLVFICFVILWTIALYISDLPLQISRILFWNKLTLAFGLLFAVSFAYFCLFFIRKEGFFIILKPPFSFIILFLLLLFALITLFTDLIVNRIEIYEWGSNIIPGNLYFLVGGFYLSAAVVGLGSLISKYKKTGGIERNQVQYLFLGFLLSAIGIFTTNLIHPAITGTNPYAKYGPYFVTFFIFFTTLAITRYHLFEIRVILTELLVGAMGVLLLIFSFLLPAGYRIFAIGVFLVFCIFAYYLIRATHAESKRREEAEKMAVRERALRQKTEEIARQETEMREKAEKMVIREKKLKEEIGKIVLEQKKIAEVHQEIAEERTRRMERVYSEAVEKGLEVIKLKWQIRELEKMLKKKKRKK